MTSRKVRTPGEAVMHFQETRYSKLTAEEFLSRTMKTDTYLAARSSDKRWILCLYENDWNLRCLSPKVKDEVARAYRDAGWKVYYDGFWRNYVICVPDPPNLFSRLIDKLFRKLQVEV